MFICFTIFEGFALPHRLTYFSEPIHLYNNRVKEKVTEKCVFLEVITKQNVFDLWYWHIVRTAPISSRRHLEGWT